MHYWELLNLCYLEIQNPYHFPSQRNGYTTHSNLYFENLLNAALILENKHRFKDDPLYGEMMRDMWSEGLTTEQVVEINKRVVMDKRSLPDVFDDDCHYACPTNRHRNIISANNFRRHILATHR